MQEEEIPNMINEIFDKYDINSSLTIVEELVEQMEELIATDSMWENAAVNENARRILCAAVGVIALKFSTVSEGMIDFINESDE
jgi:hypothetical protein